MKDQCVEDFSPDWLESHGAFNRDIPASNQYRGDGFVHIAAGFAQFANSEGDKFHYFDVRGARAMGVFDESILPYYYFMAAQFAIGDKWFSPIPSNSPPSRLYEIGATSDGLVHAKNRGLDSTLHPPIFKRLEDAGISWKVYYTDVNDAGTPNTTLLAFQPFGNSFRSKIVPVADYFTDLKNGTLPQVALIETGFQTGLDEHPGNAVQSGSAYVASIINALMQSSSWKDSVFFLTFDEAGGLYDHVPPEDLSLGSKIAVSPDGKKPGEDLELPKDNFTFCDGKSASSGICVDFTRTGFRIPNLIVSPFTRKHFVYHEAADNTAILKFIEQRFKLAPLNKRDAAQPDITPIFDFVNVPWKTAPTPPFQPGKPSDPGWAPCFEQRLF
jgi:phospholipase C